EQAQRVRVSPDGGYAAIAFDRVGRDGDPRDLQAVVVDLATGEVLTETMISPPVDPEDGRAVAGMAWQDDRTVRVAWYRVPDEEVVWLPDVVEVSTFTVP